MTSIVGSYLVIRGASMFLGGYPSEFIEINHQEDLLKYESGAVFYLISYLILMVSGVLFQRYRKYHLIYEIDDPDFLAAINHDDGYMKMNELH